MKLSKEQQNKRNKVEQILRYDIRVEFEEYELDMLLDKIIQEHENEILDIILTPFVTLNKLGLIDKDGQFSYRNEIIKQNDRNMI